MTKWKILIPLGVVIALAILYGHFHEKNANELFLTETPRVPLEKTALPPATGNIDDAVSAILAEIDEETALLDEELSDADLLTEDGELINDFDQAYDENEL
ncbi:hypothetical protein KKC32_05290 [Patescibacteria group bacterium]|nr:hypothetical protein [Patescibacteria group bacterium]